MSTAELKKTETPQEQLTRIQSMKFCKNDVMIIHCFAERGINPENIDPRNNVLTFKAWKAKNRQVAKGAISAKVTVWLTKKGKKTTNNKVEKTTGGVFPKSVSLFHASQTIPIDSPKGTKPEAWNNPQLIREGTYQAETNEPKEPPKTLLVNDLGISKEKMEKIEDQNRNEEYQPPKAIEQPDDCPCFISDGVMIMTNVACPYHGDKS